MPTLNVVNTTAMNLYIDGVKVARCNDASVSFSHAVRDITTKDSGGYQEFLEGLRSATISGGNLLAFDDTNGTVDLFDHLKDRDEVTVKFSTEVSGDKYFEADGYFTQLDVSSPGAEDNVSGSFTIQVTGVFELKTVA
jgi:hypothetical protein